MSINETATEIIEKTKGKRRRKAAKRAAAVAGPKESAMAGISVANCPTACTPARCAISLCAICAHPYKGGLQATLQTPETLRNLNEAKRLLGKQKLDLATA